MTSGHVHTHPNGLFGCPMGYLDVCNVYLGPLASAMTKESNASGSLGWTRSTSEVS